jgi:hypothetical protein
MIARIRQGMTRVEHDDAYRAFEAIRAHLHYEVTGRPE